MPDRIVAGFKGLKALDRALGKADVDLRAGLREQLRSDAEIVAEEARTIASRKGLRRSGDLIRLIRPFALTGKAGVRSSAVHRGFRYPRRLEFEGRGGNTYGPRASLLPALEAKEAEIEARAETLLDRFARDFESG